LAVGTHGDKSEAPTAATKFFLTLIHQECLTSVPSSSPASSTAYSSSPASIRTPPSSLCDIVLTLALANQPPDACDLLSTLSRYVFSPALVVTVRARNHRVEIKLQRCVQRRRPLRQTPPPDIDQRSRPRHQVAGVQRAQRRKIDHRVAVSVPRPT